MTLYGEPRVWLDQFPLNQPQPFTQDWSGIRYPGEVIRADSWQPAWGYALTGDIHFRIVLLTQPHQGDQPQIADSRIAACLPGTSAYRQRDRIQEEIATIRETQALYLTQRDPEADLIRSTLQQSRESLENELLTQEGDRYREGAVLTGPEVQDAPDGLFAGSDPVAWFSRIASFLLASAYPQQPMNANALPRPVTSDDVEPLFQEIFSSGQATAGTENTVLADLGVGLGLSQTDNPGMFNPDGCPVLGLIEDRLALTPQPASWLELHHHLSHQVGLTSPLAVLYLLIYLDQAGQEREIRLSNNHQLCLAGGRALQGTRLTADLLRNLTWDNRIATWGVTIGPATTPGWNDALNYLGIICADLQPVLPGESYAVQEQHLLKEVTNLSQRVASGQELLNLFQQSGEDLGPAAPPCTGALNRLSQISGDGYLFIYQVVRESYPDLALLEEDVERLRQLAQLAGHATEIQQAWEYLDQAPLPFKYTELSIEFQALAGALSPASLLSFSRPWTALAHQIADFKTRFSNAYRAHHQQLSQNLAAYHRDLDAARMKLRALELLNGVPELGQPSGAGLADALAGLETTLTRCPVPAVEIDLNEIPRCASCGLTLDQTLDMAGLASLAAEVDANLGEKNRMLSNLLVDKILHGQVDQQMEDFLKIVQASDLSALSNIISEELVAFICRLVG